MSVAPRGSSSSGPGWRTPAVIVACGCLIAVLTFGVRASFGLFTAPISATQGWGREVFALAIAIQNLLWGAGQPFAGALADRFGSARVLAAGGLLYAVGVALMAVASTPLQMTLTGGVLVGLGLAGGSFTIVIAALARRVPPERRSWAMGIATAAGSMGQFLLAPLGQAFILAYGWQTALLLLAGIVALVPVLATAMASTPGPSISAGEVDFGLKRTLALAFGHRSYLLLTAGFFVCGFHLAFVTVHLPPYLTDHGIAPQLAAWSIAIIGLGNIVGSYAAGVISGRHSKRWLLAAIYALRSVAMALFILLPISPLDGRAVRGLDRPALAVHHPADLWPGRGHVRHPLHGDAVRHRLLQPSGRLVPRYLAGWPVLRGLRLLRRGMVDGRGAGRVRRIDPRPDRRAAGTKVRHRCGLSRLDRGRTPV